MTEIPFNWVDWVIVTIIGLSSLISLVRGFVREAMSLASWIAAFIIARLYTVELSLHLVDYVDTPSLRLALSFLALFVLTLIAGGILNFIISQLVKATGLTAFDRLLGVGFGVVRGVVLVVVLVALAKMTPMPNDPWWQASMLLPHIELIEQWSRVTFGDVLQDIGIPASEPATDSSGQGSSA